jgi:membrane protein
MSPRALDSPKLGENMQFAWIIWLLVRDAGFDWLRHKGPQLGAAMAFYSILSLAPLLVIAVAIAAFAFGEEAAKNQLAAQMQQLMGQQGAEAIKALIEQAQQPKAGVLATVLGIATLLFGASGVFGQLQGALNTIWEVPPKPMKVWDYVKDRFLSFTMVLGTGFLMLSSLVLSTWLTAISDRLGEQSGSLEVVTQWANVLLSFAVITALFALIFRVLPDTDVGWRDVAAGAAITALLFTIGKSLIGIYLGTSGVGSAYGAAGSVVVLVIWIYYSAQIMFFGAELTHVYAYRYGSRSDRKRTAAPTKA